MKIEFDQDKSDRNVTERGLSFAKAAELDWAGAHYGEDVRRPYPERRFLAYGMIDDRLHAVCFTVITGGIRVISFRKANSREVRRYEQRADDG